MNIDLHLICSLNSDKLLSHLQSTTQGDISCLALTSQNIVITTHTKWKFPKMGMKSLWSSRLQGEENFLLGKNQGAHGNVEVWFRSVSLYACQYFLPHIRSHFDQQGVLWRGKKNLLNVDAANFWCPYVCQTIKAGQAKHWDTASSCSRAFRRWSETRK